MSSIEKHNYFNLYRAVEVLNSQGVHISLSMKADAIRISNLTINLEYLQRHNITNHPKIAYIPHNYTMRLNECFKINNYSTQLTEQFIQIINLNLVHLKDAIETIHHLKNRETKEI